MIVAKWGMPGRTICSQKLESALCALTDLP
jgi:hypothetical protein